MTKLIQILVCFLAILSVSIICHSCREPAPESDITSLVQCKCDDMACWREKTEEKAWGAIKCASEAGFLATGIGFANKVKKAVESGEKVSKTLQNADKAFEASKDIGEAYHGLSSFADPVFWAKVISSVSHKIDISGKKLACGQKAVEIIAGVFLFVLATKDYFANFSSRNNSVASDETVIEQMTEYTLNNVKTAVGDVSYQKAVAGITAAGLLTCTTCLSAIASSTSDNPVVKFLKDLISPLGDFIENALVFVVLGDCGYKLSTAGIYLLANTKCLVSDLAAVYDSYKQLDRAYANTLNTELDCNKENEKSCSKTIATNYGISLHKMISNQSWPTYLHYGSRAKQCYNYCYTTSGSKEKCNSSSISLGSNLVNPQVCRSKCENQVGSCQDLCRSFCCNQDGKCVNQVKKILESRNR